MATPLMDFSTLGGLADTFFDARDKARKRKQDEEAPALVEAYLSSLGGGAAGGSGSSLSALGRGSQSFAPASGTPRANIDRGTVHVAETEDDVQRLERATGMNTAADLDKVVRTVYGEAAGEGPAGQSAVANVIANRARQSGMTPTDVVLAKGQFEPWFNPDARARMEALDANAPEYRRLADLVGPALRGEAADPTGGATHFYAPKAQAALGRDAPSWDDGTGKDIGNHRFFAHGYSPQGSVQVAQADAPAPDAREAQFQIPGQTGLPAAQGVSQPVDRTMIRALYANPNTRPLANEILKNSLNPQSQYDFQVVGDQLYRVSKRTGQVEAVPGVTKQGNQWARLNDGTLYNQVTGETRAAGDQQERMFNGNSVDAQALNELVRTGQLTRQQAAQFAAGKTVTGPNGEQLFLTPQGVFAGPGQQKAPSPGTATAFGAPTASDGIIPLTAPKPDKPSEGQSNAALYAQRMLEADQILSDPKMTYVSQSRGQAFIGSLPGGNSFVSPEYQQVDQAKRNFINAVLRRESGAVISPEEFANADKQYFPQPGDQPAVLKQKAANRQTAIQGISNAAGPAMKQGAQAAQQASQGLQAGTYEYIPGQGLVRR